MIASAADQPAFGGAGEALALCDGLLAEQLAAAMAVFGRGALGLVDLPPLTGAPIEPEQLSVVPPLFWAREVEAAGLLPFVEALTEGVARGRIDLPIDARGARDLIAHYRRRQDRLTPEERGAIYSRLFGGPGSPDPNAEFERLFHALVATLTAIGMAPAQESTTSLAARASALAAQLASNLSSRTAGVTLFAATDIVAHIRAALALLGKPAIAAALGGGSAFTIVTRLGPQVSGRSFAPMAHLPRATSGLKVLAWLARGARMLGGGTLAIRRDDPVVIAAEQYSAASGAG